MSDILGRPPGNGAAVKKILQSAAERLNAGHGDEAVRLLESSGGPALKTHVGQNMLGTIFLQQGKHSEALRAFDTAARIMPSAPESYCNRGAVLGELGRLEEALAAENRALRLRPDYATAHYNRGNILMAMLRFDEAAIAFAQAAKAQPRLVEAHLNHGMALLHLNKPLEALAGFGRALAIRPNYVAALIGRGGAYRDMGQFEDAIAAISAVLALDPTNGNAASLLCDALVGAERFADSLAAADAFAARVADDARAHTARAAALIKLRRFDEALAAAETAVRLAPKDHEAQTILGIALREMGRLDESLAALEQARLCGASGAAFFHARAVALSILGDGRDALEDYKQALALEPDSAQAHHNLAFLRLALGDWTEGWGEHEWRLKLREHRHNTLVQIAPKWEGEALAGKRLLVYTEQGHGDTIQFVRFLRQIEASGAVVTFVVDKPVHRLFQENFPAIDVATSIGMRRDFDYQISLMSLPKIFDTTIETLPNSVPYLAASQEGIAKWRERLGVHGLRVGVVWQGSRKYTRDRDRSIPLAQYAPLARVPGVRLISLQSMVGLEQLTDLPAGMLMETLGEEISDNPDGFREVAAVMANLDLLIMSDTGPTHLAGALGRPVWLALARHPDWRWMREREDSPWYPTMRLFRQATAGDWPGVFARMADELAAAVAKRG